MSEVYLARQLPMGRVCALKVLPPARADDQDAISRFEREAALASRMTHPNLCHIYDAGRTPTGLPYLAMEWLDGLSLAELLEAGALPPERVARIVAGCAAGLAAAHEAGVIHRDLKPGNVMLVQRDGVETPVVMDFGIALAVGEAGLTRDGLMVGTPEVMSPEQIAGDPVDARNDQYQLALLACRMLAGALPFPAESSQASMVRRLTDRPTPLAALRPSLQVGTEVQRTIDRALARRPADRFPDIRSFAAGLGSALMAGPDGATEVLDRPLLPMPAAAKPPGPSSTARSAGRGWWPAAGLLLVVAVGAYVATLPPADEPDPGPVTPVPVPPVPAPSPVPVPAPISPVAPGTRTPIPALPADSLVFSTDSAVRRTAREQAERVYRSVSATDSVRATAAYFVAYIVADEGLYATARQWLEFCIALQPERTMCHRLLNTLP
jgi:serine/threonine-protein kinase